MVTECPSERDLERIKTELSWINSQQLKELGDGEVCQCRTERLISCASNRARMRAALLSLVFIDQFVHSHYPMVHLEFRKEFVIPILRHHSSGGHASPSWFVYAKHGYDKRADWSLISEIFRDCTQHLRRWLIEELNRSVPELGVLIQQEVAKEFSLSQQAYLDFHIEA